jgi:hypothetical protein
MTISKPEEQQISDFLRYLSVIDGDRTEAGFGYLALRDGEHFALCHGRVVSNRTILPSEEVATQNIRAGYLQLRDMGISIEGLIRAALSGEIATPAGPLIFEPSNGTTYNAHYQAITPEAAQQQFRLGQLRIAAGNVLQQLRRPELDWELKAHASSYDGLDDLAAQVNAGPLSTGRDVFEVLATPAVHVLYDWQYAGGAAQVKLVALPGIDTSKITLIFRKFSQRQVRSKGVVSADRISWEEKDGRLDGTVPIAVANDEQLHCTACYSGLAQNFGWVVDMRTLPNPRLTAFSAFDEGLTTLQLILSRTGRSGNAREFESAVSWLLWMLGFGTAHLGDVEVLQDGPDVIVTSASGYIAVVECTTGLLNAKNKLSLLVSRTETIKRKLQETGMANPRLLPVMFTSKTREDIRAEIGDAAKYGVHVIAKEGINALLIEARAFPNSDDLYQRAEKAAQEAKAEVEAQLSMPSQTHVTEIG